jgi:hypothetical protein
VLIQRTGTATSGLMSKLVERQLKDSEGTSDAQSETNDSTVTQQNSIDDTNDLDARLRRVSDSLERINTSCPDYFDSRDCLIESKRGFRYDRKVSRDLNIPRHMVKFQHFSEDPISRYYEQSNPNAEPANHAKTLKRLSSTENANPDFHPAIYNVKVMNKVNECVDSFDHILEVSRKGYVLKAAQFFSSDLKKSATKLSRQKTSSSKKSGCSGDVMRSSTI